MTTRSALAERLRRWLDGDPGLLDDEVTLVREAADALAAAAPEPSENRIWVCAKCDRAQPFFADKTPSCNVCGFNKGSHFAAYAVDGVRPEPLRCLGCRKPMLMEGDLTTCNNPECGRSGLRPAPSEGKRAGEHEKALREIQTILSQQNPIGLPELASAIRDIRRLVEPFTLGENK